MGRDPRQEMYRIAGVREACASFLSGFQVA